VPGLKDNVRQLSILPLVNCILGCPLQKNEPIVQKWLLFLSKFFVEECPEEIKNVLDWLFNMIRPYPPGIQANCLEATNPFSHKKKQSNISKLQNIEDTSCTLLAWIESPATSLHVSITWSPG
jgi:hypothetical protein